MANSTLLLADDSVTIQKVVNLTFSGEGIDVVTVSDGNSAMDILRENPPDLVMADVNLPGINGYEICEHVRNTDSGRETPVILLVGSFEPFDADEAQRVGATAHLTKPFESIAALVDMVQGYLGKAAPAEEFAVTAEYPTDADMVVSESSIPFVGGYEDDTIEAESYGGGEAAEEVEETPRALAAEQWARDDAPQYGVTDDLRQPEPAGEGHGSGFGEDEPSHFVEEEDSEVRFAEVAEEEEYRIEQSSDAGLEYHDPEPAEEDDEEEEGSEFIEESYYSRETYHERSIINPMGDDDPITYYPPRPLGAEDQEYEDDEEFEPYRDPAATVQLDESDLLELPIDPSFAEVERESGESQWPDAEDRFAETIREMPVPDETVGEPEAGISEEMIDEIARRVVAKLSDRAVREIAWEVVPEMAEMIIRKLTEQKLNE